MGELHKFMKKLHVQSPSANVKLQLWYIYHWSANFFSVLVNAPFQPELYILSPISVIGPTESQNLVLRLRINILKIASK